MPSDAKLTAFWDEVGDSPQMAGHHIKSVPDWKQTFVPIALHGDATPVTGCGKSWAKLLNTFSWHSLLVKGSSLMMHMYIWSIFTGLLDGSSTDDAFFHVLVWSLEAMLLGTWPTHDWHGQPMRTGQPGFALRGQPLAGGLRAVLHARVTCVCTTESKRMRSAPPVWKSMCKPSWYNVDGCARPRLFAPFS